VAYVNPTTGERRAGVIGKIGSENAEAEVELLVGAKGPLSKRWALRRRRGC